MKGSCEGYEIRLKKVSKIEFMDTSKCTNFIWRAIYSAFGIKLVNEQAMNSQGHNLICNPLQKLHKYGHFLLRISSGSSKTFKLQVS
jgi:hypothetical protein